MRRLHFSWATCKMTLGESGLAGLALIVAAVLFFSTAIQERQAGAQRLQQRAAALHERHGDTQSRTGSAATPEEALRVFVDYFPTVATLQDWIERIQAAAATAGVKIERADYKLVPEQAAGLARYQITLPVKGTYPQLRSFVAALLDAVPALALVDIDLKREAISVGTVEARLTLALFLRGGPQR